MKAGDVMFRALQAAMGWEESLSDAHRHCDDGVSAECDRMIERYRKLSVQLFGTDKSPIDVALSSCKLVTLDDLRRRAKQDV